MSGTIAEKMRIKSGARAWLDFAPDHLLETIEAPTLRLGSATEFDYMHIFAIAQSQVEERFSRLKPKLSEKGSLWVSWPKAKQLGTDLNLHEVIRIGYARGLVESTCLSIDSTWSALRFTHPKPGKRYNNSHAELVTE